MIKFYGYPFEVYVAAYFHVAMEHKSKDDAEDEALMATDKIFDDNSDVTVVKSEVTKIERHKYFDIAEVKMELLIELTAFEYGEAWGDAEIMVRETDLPVGVSLYDCEAYDYSRYNERVVDA